MDTIQGLPYFKIIMQKAGLKNSILYIYIFFFPLGPPAPELYGHQGRHVPSGQSRDEAALS